MASDGTVAGPLGDLDPEEFRRHGHAMVDWIAGFLAAPERYPVLARVKPGDVRGVLPGITRGVPSEGLCPPFVHGRSAVKSMDGPRTIHRESREEKKRSFSLSDFAL